MSDDPVPVRLRSLVLIAAICAGAIPLVALAGWILNAPALRGVLPGAIAMNPVTGAALLLLAMAVAVADRPGHTILRRVLSGAVAVAGISRLADGLGLPVAALDLVLFRQEILGLSPVPRMAYSTAICLVVLAAGLGSYRVEAPGRGRLLILPAALFALFAATGYIYQAEWFFNIPALKPMALNTAIALIALCVGVTALPPALAPTDQLVAPGVVGVTARQLIPAAFLIPFILGFFRVIAERSGWVDLGLGTAIFVVLTALILSGLARYSVLKILRAGEAQQQMERAIRTSERRLFQILEAIPVGIFVIGRDGRPYYANRRSNEIAGLELQPGIAAGDLSRTFRVYRAGTGEPYPNAELPVVRALRDERVYVTDIELGRPEGRVPIEVWAEPVKGDDGQIEYAVSAYNDITARVQAEHQIRSLNQELRHQVVELAAVNRELETFSYSVSHDLRAPLRAVDGFSRILETDHAPALDAEGHRLLGRVRDNVRRMGNLIDDLLRFSRLSRAALEVRPVDMNDLVRNVVADLTRDGASRAMVSIGPLPPAPGDMGLLRQVWTNLVSNALKYSDPGADPRIEIQGLITGGGVEYSVRDNGVGFDMAYADKLFGVFQRLHRQDEFEGTGVGLAIVQRIVHRHGGTVRAESAPGQGATFSFLLPLAETHG